jgi:EmrB/QacA subfamily drug resistance transporter
VTRRNRFFVIAAAMIALFLGALDALVVGSAMPTIIADLGGLDLYSWVFSAYLLSRAISLPIFGKLADLFSNKNLYLAAIGIFVLSSLGAGFSREMGSLILFRALQGVGAGGTFALAYIVVSGLTSPEKRGKVMGSISFVWGVASILGPAMGGFIVDYLSWQWIFFINLPLGGFALLGILFYLKEVREKARHPSIDFLGAVTLSITVVALLLAFLLAGRSYDWLSVEIILLFLITLGGAGAFWFAERRAPDPILALHFFSNRQFSLANGAAFFSSFAIFSLSAYSPLFIQGVLGKSPAELGLAMVPLSLAWSVGALLCGQMVTPVRERFFSIVGSLLLIIGTVLGVHFTPATSVLWFAAVMAVAGIGMGFVSVATLLTVQNSIDHANLGVATSSQQFARTLGGTIGIGISGGLASGYFTAGVEAMKQGSVSLSPSELNVEAILQPETLRLLPEAIQSNLQKAVLDGVTIVFWSALTAALISLVCCYFIPSLRQIVIPSTGFHAHHKAIEKD